MFNAHYGNFGPHHFILILFCLWRQSMFPAGERCGRHDGDW